MPPGLVCSGIALYALNRDVFNYSALALIYGAITLFAFTIKNPGRVRGWQGFYISSRLSYGIYLNHFGLLPHIAAKLHWLHGKGAIGVMLAYLTGFCACVLFAFMTFAFIECPFLHLREKWLDSKRGGNAIAKSTMPVYTALPTLGSGVVSEIGP